MEIEKLINRINELYHKSQDVGLTEEEAKEQKELRAAYVANIRANLKSQLDSIDIKEADGSITNLGEKHAAENENRGNDMYLETLGKNAKEAKYTIGLLDEKTRNDVLLQVADALVKESEYIIAQNKIDYDKGVSENMKAGLLDRLLLTEARIEGISEGILETKIIANWNYIIINPLITKLICFYPLSSNSLSGVFFQLIDYNTIEQNQAQITQIIRGVPLLFYLPPNLLSNFIYHPFDTLYYEDSSNHEDDFLRNRIRHHIIPLLKEECSDLYDKALR